MSCSIRKAVISSLILIRFILVILVNVYQNLKRVKLEEFYEVYTELIQEINEEPNEFINSNESINSNELINPINEMKSMTNLSFILGAFGFVELLTCVIILIGMFLNKIHLFSIGLDFEVIKLTIGAMILPFNPMIGGPILLYQAVIALLMSLEISDKVDENWSVIKKPSSLESSVMSTRNHPVTRELSNGYEAVTIF